MMNDEDELMEKYSKSIYKMAYIYLKSKYDAEDISQEVLLKCLMNKKNFKDEEHRKHWIIKVTAHMCINLKKSAWKRKVVPLRDDDTIEFRTEEELRVFYDLERLDEKYRMVLQLFYYEDLSTKQISKILGITEANVRTRLNRARNELKIDLEKGEEMYEKL